MRKNGFTMIELVFIIAVLGILAGVALPRLSATRDDVDYVKALTDLETFINDVQNMYYSQGIENIPTLGATGDKQTYLDMSAITNVGFDYEENAKEPIYYVGGKPCFRADVVKASLGKYDRDVILVLLKPKQAFRKNWRPACKKLVEHQLFKQYNHENLTVIDILEAGEPEKNRKIIIYAGGAITGGSSGLFSSTNPLSLEELAKITGKSIEKLKEATIIH